MHVQNLTILRMAYLMDGPDFGLQEVQGDGRRHHRRDASVVKVQ